VLKTHWDGKIPVDVFALCKRMDVALELFDFDDAATVTEVGLLNGSPAIRLSNIVYKAGGTRWSFAVAHALGHLVLHGDGLKELPSKTPREAFRFSPDDYAC
jgi:hypothetical protein